MAVSEGEFPTVTETATLQPHPRAAAMGLRLHLGTIPALRLHLLALVLPPPVGCLDFLLLNYPLTLS